MAGSIDTFIHHFESDFGRSNNFKATWMVPQGTGVDDGVISRCTKSISIPGITFIDTSYSSCKFIVNYDFDSFDATFYVDADGELIESFLNWQKAIYNQQTGFFGYKNDYAATLLIELLSRGQEPYATVAVQKCYPINFSPVEVSYDSKDTIIEYNISFNFDNYYLQTSNM
jgi:hypothetical protein